MYVILKCGRRAALNGCQMGREKETLKIMRKELNKLQLLICEWVG
jgi:hypothetical protein